MQKTNLETSSNHSPSTIEVREKWLRHLRQARREYAFQKWGDQRKQKKISFKEITEWIYDDIKHIVVWNINILMQLRAYGAPIKKAYGLSYLNQWYRMTYLVFVIRTSAKNFRYIHLFNNDRWNRVKEFSLQRHIKVHNNILGYPHSDELEIVVNKLKFFEFCQAREIQTPEILAIYEEGKISLPSGGIFKIPKSDLFVKELSSEMGRGAKKFRYRNSCFHDRDGMEYTEEELHKFLKDYSLKTNSIIVQHALKNHDSWKKFTSGGLATCRIVTGISSVDKHEIIPFFASMKMPTGNIDADNFSKGSLAASVDIDSGIMNSAVSFKPTNGSFTFDVHPDTGHPIKGETLPFWSELIEFVKHLHQHFQTIAIGWDVSLTEEGVSVVEGNVEWGANIIESPANCSLADTIYSEWFDGWAKQMEGKEIVPYSLPWYKV